MTFDDRVVDRLPEMGRPSYAGCRLQYLQKLWGFELEGVGLANKRTTMD